jgi:RHS repeat-associated protein
VGTIQGGAAYQIAPDHLGAPYKIVNSANAQVWVWDHDPFGNGAPTAAAGFWHRLRFPGQVYDSESKLHSNGQRDYDPRLGRYVESDPIGLAGGINTYAYAGNDPVNMIDPLGLDGERGSDGFWSDFMNYLSNSWNSLARAPSDIRDNPGGVLRSGLEGLAAVGLPAARAAGVARAEIVTIKLSRKLHGEAAQHAADAIKAGKPDLLTVDRAGTAANRQAAIGELEKIPGKHLDEYPPAMFREGGANASVRAIDPRDNMSAGACIGNACRGLPDGTQVRIVIGD